MRAQTAIASKTVYVLLHHQQQVLVRLAPHPPLIKMPYTGTNYLHPARALLRAETGIEQAQQAELCVYLAAEGTMGVFVFMRPEKANALDMIPTDKFEFALAGALASRVANRFEKDFVATVLPRYTATQQTAKTSRIFERTIPGLGTMTFSPLAQQWFGHIEIGRVTLDLSVCGDDRGPAPACRETLHYIRKRFPALIEQSISQIGRLDDQVGMVATKRTSKWACTDIEISPLQNSRRFTLSFHDDSQDDYGSREVTFAGTELLFAKRVQI